MKNLRKIFAVVLVLVLVCAAFAACGGNEHVCESKCEECGKCTDAACTEAACKDKCAGHEDPPPAHTCESKCAECGKCTDASCTEAACANKCEGHAPAAHECESKCGECGKCLDAACTEAACAEKCAGHAPVTKNAVLQGTYTRNIRVGSSPFVTMDDELAIIEDGLTIYDTNASFAIYKGTENVDYLVGLPVVLTYDGKKVAKVELRGTMVTYHSADFVVTDATTLTLKDGTVLKLDENCFNEVGEGDNLIKNWQYHTYSNRGFIWGDAFNPFDTTATNGLYCDGQNEITFVDIDGDGDYDHIRQMLKVTTVLTDLADGKAVLGMVEETGTVISTTGSTSWTGWVNGAKAYEVEFAPGVEAKNGDWVSGHLIMDQTSETEGYSGMMLKLYVTDVLEVKTGVFTDINATDWTNISVKVDGADMKWSSLVKSNVDGEGGAVVGRNLMLAANNGKTFKYVADASGRIVFARLEGAENEGPKDGLYFTLATWWDNARSGSNPVAGENEIVLVEWGMGFDATVSKKYKKAATCEATLDRGALYNVTFDADGNIATATPIDAANKLVILENDFAWDGSVATANGAALNLDADLIAAQNTHVLWDKIIYVPTAATLETLSANKSDDILTLYDVDGDGDYDYIHAKCVLNGIVARVVEGGRVSLQATYGSRSDSGWFQSTLSAYYNAPEGVTLAVGDVVAFTVRIDKTITYTEDYQGGHTGFPAAIEVVGVGKKVTGTAENVVVGTNASGEPDYTKITFTMNGVNYEWSNNICTSAYSDGANGTNAGRDTFTSGNKYDVYLDNAGLVVYAKAAE